MGIINPDQASAQKPNSADFQMDFQGSVAERHLIPADVLAESIEALQKIVHILAMEHEQRDVNERLRVPESIAVRYTVMCATPAIGSYSQPFCIESQKPNLVTPQDIEQVRGLFVDSLSALSNPRSNQLGSVVSSQQLRRRLFTAFRSLLPKVGSGFSVTLTDFRADTQHSYRFDDRHALYLREAMDQAEYQIVRQTVTGRLEKIHFGERRITIIYTPTGKELTCLYDDGIEEMLLENRREKIQVSGIVTLGEDDHPSRVTDVNSISYLDLSPFVVDELEYEKIKLKFHTPLSLDVELDESEQLLVIENDEWGIHVFAQTKEYLWEELKEQLLMLWKEYAMEEDVNLSEPAQRLKQHLLDNIEAVPLLEVTNAEGA